MDLESNLDSKLRERIRSLWLVIAMAVCTGALRLAMWAASELTLRYLYGQATVARLHLRIVRIKPQLVVSNGDVLRGIGIYHYLLGVAIWLTLSIVLLLVIYCRLVPSGCRKVFELPPPKAERSTSLFALIWVLAPFFLVAGMLPIAAAIALSAISVMIALIWVRRIEGRSAVPAKVQEGHL